MKYIKMYEDFVGGVNYDSIASSVLKSKVGDLSNLTPYILEYGNRIISDGDTFDIYQDNNLIKKGITLDDFLTNYCGRPKTLK